MWTLPILLLTVTLLWSIPLSRYFAWIMDGRYKAPRLLAWLPTGLDPFPIVRPESCRVAMRW